MNASLGHTVEALHASDHTVPTEFPESDGTFEWDHTTLVLVQVSSGNTTGIGYTYGDAAVADLVRDLLAPAVIGANATAPGVAWEAMLRAARNAGLAGPMAQAVSAVDTALWDLKARLLRVPLTALFPGFRAAAPAYASGGFTSYPLSRLQTQLSDWSDRGYTAVKIKVGRDDAEDEARVRAARATLAPEVTLMVDANGAYTPRQAIERAHRFAEHGVGWLEEPVTSDDPDGLRFVRDHAPAGMLVTAGEYTFDPWAAQQLLKAQAVDVLQLDATRCLGFTGALLAAAAAATAHVPVSTHTAPQLHVHLAAGVRDLHSVEWFHDHARVESLLFEDTVQPHDGIVAAKVTRTGNGLVLRATTAKQAA
jgi:L-alanine-DL-glutamate epimerase-like enolase superfamily enzyme